jgi:hypothetical protein
VLRKLRHWLTGNVKALDAKLFDFEALYSRLPDRKAADCQRADRDRAYRQCTDRCRANRDCTDCASREGDGLFLKLFHPPSTLIDRLVSRRAAP